MGKSWKIEVVGSLTQVITMPGWWFGTCFMFPYFVNNHPN
jgi:hypothetical protein